VIQRATLLAPHPSIAIQGATLAISTSSMTVKSELFSPQGKMQEHLRRRVTASAGSAVGHQFRPQRSLAKTQPIGHLPDPLRSTSGSLAEQPRDRCRNVGALHCQGHPSGDSRAKAIASLIPSSPHCFVISSAVKSVRSTASQVQLLEDAVGNVADHEHDRLPLERHVKIVRTLIDRVRNRSRNLVHVGELL
jgi:hypothetical protein